MKPLPLGVYRHYSGLLVQLLAVAEHTETKEILAIYICLGHKAGYKIRARPLTMFNEDVETDGARVPRFVYLGLTLPQEEQDTERGRLGQYPRYEDGSVPPANATRLDK